MLRNIKKYKKVLINLKRYKKAYLTLLKKYGILMYKFLRKELSMKFSVLTEGYPYSNKFPLGTFNALHEAIIFAYSLICTGNLPTTKKGFIVFAHKGDIFCLLKSKEVACVYKDGSREYNHEVLNSLGDTSETSSSHFSLDIEELKEESRNCL